MPKILLITGELTKQSGWGRYTLDLSRQLMLSGYQPIIVCKKVNPSFPEFEQIAILPDQLNYKKCYLLFWIYFIKLFKYRKKLKNISLVHCIIETYLPFSTTYSLLFRLPLVATIHGSYGVKTSYNTVYRLLQSFCYGQVGKIVCVSHYVEKRLLRIYPHLNNTTVIPNGVDLANFFITDKQPLKPSSNPVLIGVGALKQRKGFHVVLNSLPIILKKFPNLKYYIVGRVEKRAYFEYLTDIISKFNLSEHVVFVQDLTSEDLDDRLKKLYQESSVFILTPISDEYNFEGFGLVYLEANANGLPVVGSYDNGGEDAIVNGKTGFLVQPNDANSTATAVIDLLSNHTQYDMMSHEATKWAESHGWGLIASKYIQVYKQTIEMWK